MCNKRVFKIILFDWLLQYESKKLSTQENLSFFVIVETELETNMGEKKWLNSISCSSPVSLHNAQIFRLLLKISVQRNNFENLLFLTAHHQWANQSYLTAKLGREFLREFFFWFVRGEKVKLLGSSSCQLEVVACLCNSATWELVVVDNLRLGALHHSYLCW